MRDIYQRLRGLDDGLPPIESTNLLSSTGCNGSVDTRALVIRRNLSARFFAEWVSAGWRFSFGAWTSTPTRCARDSSSPGLRKPRSCSPELAAHPPPSSATPNVPYHKARPRWRCSMIPTIATGWPKPSGRSWPQTSPPVGSARSPCLAAKGRCGWVGYPSRRSSWSAVVRPSAEMPSSGRQMSTNISPQNTGAR